MKTSNVAYTKMASEVAYESTRSNREIKNMMKRCVVVLGATDGNNNFKARNWNTVLSGLLLTERFLPPEASASKCLLAQHSVKRPAEHDQPWSGQ